jgi:hypothetical protein
MDDFQFLKEEITSPKFNKRIFYAKNAKKYIELMSIDLFVNNYIPFITNYIYNDENIEEVLTEYSKTFTEFLKYLGNETTFQNYSKINSDNNESDKTEENTKYNNSIVLIIKCFFEKFFINEDEILKETTFNNIKELFLELDNYILLKKEFENYLNINKINKDSNQSETGEDNKIIFSIFSLLYPLIIDDEQKITNYCNKFKLILKNNNQLKKKRLVIQNIFNIIPFMKNSIDKIKNDTSNESENNDKNNIINRNINLMKEIISSLNHIMDDKNLIVKVEMNYVCEIIVIYTIQNITDFILFYDEYNDIFSNQEIESIINSFIVKLENFINNESILKITLTWRIKVAYIENICRLNKIIMKNSPNYYNDYFSTICQKILENNNKEPDLKISVLNHIDFLIPKLPTFIQIFKNINSTEQNMYVRSNLAIALNKILNNPKFYELNENNNDFHSKVINIFNIIQNMLDKEKFDVKYNLLSTVEFDFFNIIKDDNFKVEILNKSIKLIIIVFEKVNEWRIRYSIYNKVETFLSNKDNFLKITNLYQQGNNMNINQNPNQENINVEMVKNLRNLIKLFFNDKANIIRTNCLNLIDNIISMQKDNNIQNDLWIIRIQDELLKYQFSLFSKNNNFEEGENFINNIISLNVNKNYYIKIFFLESIKKFIHLYSNIEKNIIKEIVGLIKNDKQYSNENVANGKIMKDIELILEKLNEV